MNTGASQHGCFVRIVKTPAPRRASFPAIGADLIFARGALEAWAEYEIPSNTRRPYANSQHVLPMLLRAPYGSSSRRAAPESRANEFRQAFVFAIIAYLAPRWTIGFLGNFAEDNISCGMRKQRAISSVHTNAFAKLGRNPFGGSLRGPTPRLLGGESPGGLRRRGLGASMVLCGFHFALSARFWAGTCSADRLRVSRGGILLACCVRHRHLLGNTQGASGVRAKVIPKQKLMAWAADCESIIQKILGSRFMFRILHMFSIAGQCPPRGR